MPTSVIEYDRDTYRTAVADHFLAILLDPRVEISISSGAGVERLAPAAPLRALLVELLTRMRLGLITSIVAADGAEGVADGE